ncbi:MAG TPA: Hint domain-containing protein [Chloroflexota bacterium]|nr:Hint domain-containing protein [Chloroflexota bacterium]
MAQSDGTFAFNAQFGTERVNGVRIAGSVDSSGTIKVASKQPAPFLNCPICLARGTPIATPGGDVTVESIRPGMTVWTLDQGGGRQLASVLQTGSIPVSADRRGRRSATRGWPRGARLTQPSHGGRPDRRSAASG